MGKTEMNRIAAVLLIVLSGITHAAIADVVAYWGMDEKDGNIAVDSVGHCDGEFHGEPVRTDGYFSGSLIFDGIDDYVRIQQDPIIDTKNALTVAAWIKVDAFDREWQTIVAKGDRAWRLARNSFENGIEFAANYPPEIWFVRGTTSVNDGRWHHVAGVYDGSKAYLYIDSELDDDVEVVRGINTNDFRICIGENPEARERYWHGMIDDVIIFDEALSQDGIRQLYELGGRSFISKSIQKVTSAIQHVKEMLDEQQSQMAINFIEKAILNCNSLEEKNLIDPELCHKLLSSLYFLLGRARESSGAPRGDVATAYERSASISLQMSHYVPALMWLAKNVPTNEYARIVKESIDSTISELGHIHHIAKDFNTYEDWDTFKLFLDTLFSQVEDPTAFAKAISEEFKEDSFWSDKFSLYCRNLPALRKYYIQSREELALENMKQEKFTKAADIYGDIVEICGSDSEKGPYKYKICQCIFYSGKYNTAISYIEDLITSNIENNRIIVKQALVLKGRAYIQQDKIDEASDVFLRLLIDYPETKQAPEANFFVGYCHMLKGENDKAKDVFDMVVEDYPQDSYAHKARLCLARIKRTEQ